MRIRVRIIKSFSILCAAVLVLVFVLNYVNELKLFSFPKALSFSFLNMLLGGILASALVVLISEIISYCIAKREMILKTLQILQSEYVSFSFVTTLINENISKDFFYVQALFEKLNELIKADDRFKEVDISLLFDNSVTKSLRDIGVKTGAAVSVFSKLYCSMNELYDAEHSSISYDGKIVVLTPTESIRNVLKKIQEHSLCTCNEISEAMISLDTKKINYHWNDRKLRLDTIFENNR